MSPAPVRFGVIGVNHPHIFEMTELLVQAGAEMVGFFAVEDDLAAAYVQRFSDARRLRSEADAVENPVDQGVRPMRRKIDPLGAV